MIFFQQENTLYPIILSSRKCNDILYYKSISFPWKNPVLIFFSLPVQVRGLNCSPHWPSFSGNRPRILSWHGQMCSVCWHSLRGCYLTVIFNQRSSACLDPDPKPQSNLPAVFESSFCLQQLSLSRRSSTDKKIQFLFLFNLQLNFILGQSLSILWNDALSRSSIN